MDAAEKAGMDREKLEACLATGEAKRKIQADIDEADAMSHVAGFCVVNDVSEREYQLERCGTWDKGKGCDTFGPLGPWLVTRDEVADPHDLAMWLEVDGKRYQDGSTQTMVFQVPHLVAYLSRFMSLQPGDVISTGTPPGVGMGQNPKVFLKPGQTADYIDTGKVRMVFRDFPLDNLAFAAAVIARCMEDNRYLGFVNMLYEQQDSWRGGADPLGTIALLARLGGMSQVRFDTCLNDDQVTGQIVLSEQMGRATFGVRSTPTFIINDRPVEGAITFEEWQSYVDPLVN